MPKKSRRVRAKTDTGKKVKPKPTLSQTQQPRLIEEQTPLPEPKKTAPATTPQATTVTPDRYRYIAPELRRIGIYGGILIVVLIALTFVLG